MSSSRKSAEARQDGNRSDATEIVPHWWRKTCTKESYDQGGALCCAGATAVLRVELAGSPCEAFLDTGSSQSFISPKIVEQLQLKVRRLPKEHRFTVAIGAQLRIDRVVTGLTLWCGHTCFSGDFLVGPVPYDLVLGLDWLTEHKVAWYFQSDKLRTYVNGQWCELPVVRTGETTLQRDSPTVVHQRTGREAYEILAKLHRGMSAEEAAVFLLPPPRMYKSHAKTKAKAQITSLVRQAADDTNDLSTPLHCLHLILALPEAGSAVPLRLSDEWQGALCCALIGSKPTSSGCRSLLASTTSVAAESDEESPWPTAKLEHTLFDERINSTEAQDIPCKVAQVLHEYRAVFPDTLSKGLPPKRPHNHHILLMPGKLPARSAIYRMTPDQLKFHKQEIAKLSDIGWIGPTYSRICSPTIMVDKRGDGSGERKMRMVVNYQALNALTIAPDFPLPPIQTILELLAGAKYFSTLDLEAGFHQIRMAKEDRWKTAFRSVLGLFEYQVMPFGLKGAPATFQANINAYLQPLLGQGVIA
ncbi:LOW QUALITY PROTEIN: OSJNBa0079C19.6 protein, related [Eimeria necatrix]|uniref:OSJNBa0079C19.6 protein, related n=1 Tax=Eimeria necatrix TaxID=51315 RepID=U6N3R1_9EIME|nr:LOW QUALITY PROTEIN: OSJNBa0079C19.6 protein, related [Eimeria necatrix]CDJ69949.1 OSJNBa0079C19.6 protein, related [Eimeria necatrix]